MPASVARRSPNEEGARKKYNKTSIEQPGFAGRRLILVFIGLILAVTSIACNSAAGGNAPLNPAARVTPVPVLATNPTPTAPGGSDPATSEAPAPTSTEEARATPDFTSTGTPGTFLPDQNAELSLNLTILAPTQGAGLEVGAIRVLGLTKANAKVTVNGIPTDVASDGSFTKDLILGEGLNTVEATAVDSSGQQVSENLVVLYVPRPEGVPLSILFPQGLEVSDPDMTIMGATRADAVVGVNGIPVEVNSFGIFTASVVLEQGTNLIEVVAADLDENVNFQSVVVFYIPQ